MYYLIGPTSKCSLWRKVGPPAATGGNGGEQPQQQSQPSGASTGGGGDEAIDAEFEVKQ
jgi:hypothetical protein